MGRTLVSWNANDESDLWGYRVLWSNRINHEFSVIHASPILDTMFVDSLNLNFSEENIFYKVVAYDKRNNASEDSETMKLKRPDIIPPGAPSIKSIETNNDTVWVTSHRSGSGDAILHQLFRKDLNDLYANWMLVKVYDENIDNSDFEFMDTKLPVGGKYAYTMIAYDEANLKSKPSKPKSVVIKAAQNLIEPIISFELSRDEERVILSWELDQKLEYTNILLYRGSKEHKITKYKYLSSSTNSFVDLLESEKSYYYFIKPSYEGQLSDCKSEILLAETKSE